jgi:hypothetical protein
MPTKDYTNCPVLPITYVNFSLGEKKRSHGAFLDGDQKMAIKRQQNQP